MKRIILMVIGITVLATAAYAAVSSPCSGYRKPPKEPAPPREYVETGNRRDVIDNRVPTHTKKEGAINILKATEDRETLISGRE